MTTEEKDIQNNDDFQYDEKYDEKLMDHDYDGIKELDNPAPAWIMAIFYLSISFAVFYGAYYFWFAQGLNQEEEYAAMNMAHTEKYKNVNQSTADLVLLEDEASLAEGELMYKEMTCVNCHGAKGEGTIGPNLADNTSIHGCKFEEIFSIIKNGNSVKGMASYKNQMSDKKIQKVTSYILVKFKGTNPANAKAAEGKECK